MALNFSERVEENAKDLVSIDHMLGKGLMMPFANTNAGVNVAQYIW